MKYPVAHFIQRFFSHYLPIQRGLARNTILAYRDSIKLLLCYTADTLKKSVDRLNIEDLNESRVVAFLDSVESRRGCSVRTRNARLAAIRTFFNFVAREEPALIPQSQTVHAIPVKRTAHKAIGYLEEGEMRSLLDTVDSNSRTGIRDHALLILLYNTGSRVSEIVGLKTTDLRLDSASQVRLLGKGNKQRSCPLWPETIRCLNAYLETRIPKDTGTPEIFLNANGAPITRFGVRHIIRKYATMAQDRDPFVEKVNPHTIRHTTAMHLLRAGNDINMVSYWLGHADINTTHTYLEIDMDMKRQMLQKFEPPIVGKTLPWQKPDILEWLSHLTTAPQLCRAKSESREAIPAIAQNLAVRG